MTVTNELVWLGQKASAGRTLAIFCEDEIDEIARRQIAINAALGITHPEHQLKHFYLQSRIGADTVLMAFNKDGTGSETAFFREVARIVQEKEIDVLILDNLAQLYGGDENDRFQVTQFMNSLNRLGGQRGITILALGHPSKGDGSEWSGSTAWDASVRSRIFFGRVSPKAKPSDSDFDIRTLKRSKSNYSQIGEEIQLVRKNGVYVVMSGIGEIRPGEEARARLVEEKFVQILEKLTKQGRHVSHSKKAEQYAPRVMAAMPEGAGVKIKEFEVAMIKLINAGVLLTETPLFRRSGKMKYGLSQAPDIM